MIKIHFRKKEVMDNFLAAKQVLSQSNPSSWAIEQVKIYALLAIEALKKQKQTDKVILRIKQWEGILNYEYKKR